MEVNPGPPVVRGNACCLPVSYKMDSAGQWFHYLEIPKTTGVTSLEYFSDAECTLPRKTPDSVELRLVEGDWKNQSETVMSDMFVLYNLTYILYHDNYPIAFYGYFSG